MDKLVFLCGARDYHAMDWYKSAKEIVKDKEVVILTDLISGEGFKKIVSKDDIIFNLIIIDKLLFSKQFSFANLWRNILKFILLPFQVHLLKKFHHKFPNSVYHAHSMYYIWLASFAKVPFIGTPQGSEILLNLDRSIIYKFLTKKAFKNAKAITVDSENMKLKIKMVSNVNVKVIQNGIDLERIFESNKKIIYKNRNIEILSIRALTSLYRITNLICCRNNSSIHNNVSIKFIYPYFEVGYKKELFNLSKINDSDDGRVDRDFMYQIMNSSKLVVSIPISDSSPRSVYESIFCGCAVAITYNKYYDDLPNCMKSRIIIVDLNDNLWLDRAIKMSEEIIKQPYRPSSHALDLFDQKSSFLKIINLLSN